MSIVYHLFKAHESTRQWFVSFQYVSSESIKTPRGNRLQVMNIGNSGQGWRGGVTLPLQSGSEGTHMYV